MVVYYNFPILGNSKRQSRTMFVFGGGLERFLLIFITILNLIGNKKNQND
ncbi:MAG: Unknown protein [uncultured Aureispira sp.]|uniref:Uncharacterized protein n=1 Tax=uncultured Aureispira sp. TaxID=1331704 RepID=A0A6S6S0L0_9BACT|nr:MAG: Unknown protein [uncultured Aureispira sp.]